MTTETRPTTAYRRPSDAELVARCRSGDEQAWGELVAHFSPQVHAIARRAYGLRVQDAEEIFQETFARAFQHLHALRDAAAFGSWIRSITRRLCIDHLGRTPPPQATDDDLEDLASDDRLELIDEAMAAQQALATLAMPAREVLERVLPSRRILRVDLPVARHSIRHDRQPDIQRARPSPRGPFPKAVTDQR